MLDKDIFEQNGLELKKKHFYLKWCIKTLKPLPKVLEVSVPNIHR